VKEIELGAVVADFLVASQKPPFPVRAVEAEGIDHPTDATGRVHGEQFKRAVVNWKRAAEDRRRDSSNEIGSMLRVSKEAPEVCYTNLYIKAEAEIFTFAQSRTLNRLRYTRLEETGHGLLHGEFDPVVAAGGHRTWRAHRGSPR
jgi:hypothetical protein